MKLICKKCNTQFQRGDIIVMQENCSQVCNVCLDKENYTYHTLQKIHDLLLRSKNTIQQKNQIVEKL